VRPLARPTPPRRVGIDRDNVILVTRYDLRRPVTRINVGEVRAEVDSVIKGLAGREVPGSSAAIDGACNQALGRPVEEHEEPADRALRRSERHAVHARAAVALLTRWVRAGVGARSGAC
jgi:hypothetical protein